MGGSQFDPGPGRKISNYLVAEFGKSEKGYRLNYENNYA
jgi:hypothetical protein